MKPNGPFDLLHQNQFFNGWPTLRADNKTIVMCFPVEGWTQSAAVTFSQRMDGTLDIHVYGTLDSVRAEQQALSALSLDEDGSEWMDTGKQDDVIGRLQRTYKFMRPSLFHSPYEAAAAFIIGHRITIAQARKIRTEMAQELGDRVVVEGEEFYAFPQPHTLLALKEYKGLSETKIQRLHAVAAAALNGKLNRAYLRGIDELTALSELETLPGIGPFFSQGILYRGVGIKDGFTHDDMTYHAIKTAYKLADNASNAEVIAIAERWHPYRMWAIVLLHVWMRETNNFPKKPMNR